MWTPDGRSITSAASDQGVPHLYEVLVDGGAARVLVCDYSVDPAWQPAGAFVVYSGVTPEGAPRPLPGPVNLTRGARRLKFLAGGREFAFLRGSIAHKDLWLADPNTGAERQLTSLPDDFEIQDFDISADSHEVVLERVQERSDIVLLDLAGQ